MTGRTTRRIFASAALLAPLAALLHAQGSKKSFTFHGKVESIDAPSKSMTINGDKVDGWMEAMSMKYQVDNADVFKTVKVGDMIEATVYDGDYKLYKVHVSKIGQKQ
ncbi:MAG: copper-binding protein [Acidobacteriota bacterium]